MFIEKPADKRSLAYRKLVHGVGTNNAPYMVYVKDVEGKSHICPVYKRWKSMLSRCYSLKVQEKQPTYKGCSVSDSWLTFMNFRNWYLAQDSEGKVLDKDLKIPGNKVYSSETCLMVPATINTLLFKGQKYDQDLPLGVHRTNSKKYPFVSYVHTLDHKRIHVGRFDNVEEARLMYVQAKNKVILEVAKTYPEYAPYLKQHLYV